MQSFAIPSILPHVRTVPLLYRSGKINTDLSLSTPYPLSDLWIKSSLNLMVSLLALYQLLEGSHVAVWKIAGPNGELFDTPPPQDSAATIGWSKDGGRVRRLRLVPANTKDGGASTAIPTATPVIFETPFITDPCDSQQLGGSFTWQWGKGPRAALMHH